MDKAYADTVRLLLTIAPDVFSGDRFAMKGGTAINLFVRDMPRLSVDIDVVYVSWQTPREQSLQEIAGELEAISGRLAQPRSRSRSTRSSAARFCPSNDGGSAIALQSSSAWSWSCPR